MQCLIKNRIYKPIQQNVHLSYPAKQCSRMGISCLWLTKEVKSREPRGHTVLDLDIRWKSVVLKHWSRIFRTGVAHVVDEHILKAESKENHS